ncbi:hypothetical protein [Kamptonema formosum]|uniref:hypothetical protein n=1 Tax=Kamptonema formosum TaxID=331992 RepID=UPI0012DC5723|nr:hypothetical protein [Oscillatoria sp. PCC 10802]
MVGERNCEAYSTVGLCRWNAVGAGESPSPQPPQQGELEFLRVGGGVEHPPAAVLGRPV